MTKCNNCNYRGKTWLFNSYLEVLCPVCKERHHIRFLEHLNARALSYEEAIKLYDKYEESFIQHDAEKKSTWAELDVVMNESISRRIRAISAKDKLA